jgi:hypothetical protein
MKFSEHFRNFRPLFEHLFYHKILGMKTDWGEYERLNSFTKIGVSHHVSCPMHISKMGLLNTNIDT